MIFYPTFYIYCPIFGVVTLRIRLICIYESRENRTFLIYVNEIACTRVA